MNDISALQRDDRTVREPRWSASTASGGARPGHISHPRPQSGPTERDATDRPGQRTPSRLTAFPLQFVGRPRATRKEAGVTRTARYTCKRPPHSSFCSRRRRARGRTYPGTGGRRTKAARTACRGPAWLRFVAAAKTSRRRSATPVSQRAGWRPKTQVLARRSIYRAGGRRRARGGGSTVAARSPPSRRDETQFGAPVG
jgi:hypothetical protein